MIFIENFGKEKVAFQKVHKIITITTKMLQ